MTDWRFVDCTGPLFQRPIKDIPACIAQSVMHVPQSVMRVVKTPGDATLGDYGTVLSLALFAWLLAVFAFVFLVEAILDRAAQKKPK